MLDFPSILSTVKNIIGEHMRSVLGFIRSNWKFLLGGIFIIFASFEISENVSALREDIKSLKSDISDLELEVWDIQSETSEIREVVRYIEWRVSN